jgi:hypothetical protein
MFEPRDPDVAALDADVDIELAIALGSLLFVPLQSPSR